MSLPVVIPRGERGKVRVFHVTSPQQNLDALGHGQIGETLLGHKTLGPDQLEFFPVTNLTGLGLSGYLTEGHGIPEMEIAPDIEQLDALDGHVLLLRSAAIPASGATLHLPDGVVHVATYAEEQTDWSATPMETESALPYSAPKPSPRAARAEARRIGGRIFAIFMILIPLVLALVIF